MRDEKIGTAAWFSISPSLLTTNKIRIGQQWNGPVSLAARREHWKVNLLNEGSGDRVCSVKFTSEL